MKKDELIVHTANMRGVTSKKKIAVPKYMRYYFGGALQHEGFLVIQHNGEKFERVLINMNNGSVMSEDLVLRDTIPEEQLNLVVPLEQMEKEIEEAGYIDRWKTVKKIN